MGHGGERLRGLLLGDALLDKQRILPPLAIQADAKRV